MMRKVICFLIIPSLLIPLGGCWNYRGLNQMTTAVGIAIDKNPKNGTYHLSYEIVDLSVPIKTKGMSSKIIESEGKTLFDALRNVKKRVSNKLYVGHMQIIIISEEIARTEDISNMIDLFLRDGEFRETIYVLISQEKTAHDILHVKGIGQAIISGDIQKIVDSDSKVTASTLSVQLYQLFNTLKAEGQSLALPAIHNVFNDGELVSEVNGIAVFKGEKLTGFLTPEESKYYLFAIDEVKGGLLTYSSTGGRINSTLEISRNRAKRSFEFKDGKLKIAIKTDTDVYLAEIMEPNDALDEQQIAAFEKSASAGLEQNIRRVIQKVQFQYDSDIFGFGNMIYKKDDKLWNQLKDKWDEQFQSLEVEVQSNIHILNTASTKKS